MTVPRDLLELLGIHAGRPGDDVLIGHDALAEVLIGGAGNDYVEGGAGAVDILIGGSGIDTVGYAGSHAAVRVDLGAGWGGFASVSGGDAEGDALVWGFENAVGSGFGDSLAGDGGRNVLAGLDGDDVLEGRGGDDILLGGAGADTLDGGDGIDTASYALSATGVIASLFSGVGGIPDEVDTLRAIENLAGSAHADALYGDAGDNRIDGGAGDDFISGEEDIVGEPGRGQDLLIGGDGDDTIQGNAGRDEIHGDAGNDFLDGGEEADIVHGGAGDDIIIGEDGILAPWVGGADLLDGGDGDDSISGNAGDDVVIGGLGRDVLSDGNGADRYVFRSTAESAVDRPDAIGGFTAGEDRIDLAQIDADTGRRGDQAFTVIGDAQFSGKAGELRVALIETIPGDRFDYVVEGDVDGDGHADVRIEVGSTIGHLTAGDFIL
ncbi:calcium-binding protein [Inquilinus sp.]|uniref:calcium-binding protein n=1 Tax=Inquilinus sp. TaxID=1932117 RepID=UPI0031CDB41E